MNALIKATESAQELTARLHYCALAVAGSSPEDFKEAIDLLNAAIGIKRRLDALLKRNEAEIEAEQNKAERIAENN